MITAKRCIEHEVRYKRIDFILLKSFCFFCSYSTKVNCGLNWIFQVMIRLLQLFIANSPYCFLLFQEVSLSKHPRQIVYFPLETHALDATDGSACFCTFFCSTRLKTINIIQWQRGVYSWQSVEIIN